MVQSAKSASETLAGYMAKLRYEGFGLDDCKDFWVNLCVDQVYPVGWCASQQKPLIPPKSEYTLSAGEGHVLAFLRALWMSVFFTSNNNSPFEMQRNRD